MLLENEGCPNAQDFGVDICVEWQGRRLIYTHRQETRGTKDSRLGRAKVWKTNRLAVRGYLSTSSKRQMGVHL